jgi:membrane-associated phospholipid phosphatase
MTENLRTTNAQQLSAGGAEFRQSRVSRRAMLYGGAAALSCPGLALGSSFSRPERLDDLHATADETSVMGLHDCRPVAWNSLVRRLVIAGHYDPPHASRIYACASIAQACAASLIATRPGVANDHRDALVHVASSIGALETVAAFFQGPQLPKAGHRRQISDDGLQRGLSSHEIADASQVGAEIAGRVLARAGRSGPTSAATSPAPARAVWRSDGGRPPVRPYWGKVSPLLIDLAELPMRPPPRLDSPDFGDALQHVATRTREANVTDARVVALWADGVGTSTPPGHWNRIACRLVEKHRVDDRRALDVLALLNLALFDAGILCWRVKFTYWLARPHQMDPTILPLVSVPNFPAYPSGHSAFSGAAAEVLTHFFPAEAKRLAQMAAEASESRVLGGLHYAFDCEEGLRLGRWVGEYATRTWAGTKTSEGSMWLNVLSGL